MAVVRPHGTLVDVDLLTVGCDDVAQIVGGLVVAVADLLQGDGVGFGWTAFGGPLQCHVDAHKGRRVFQLAGRAASIAGKGIAVVACLRKHRAIAKTKQQVSECLGRRSCSWCIKQKARAFSSTYLARIQDAV